jgi:4'-phosphopantetheinyl transferase
MTPRAMLSRVRGRTLGPLVVCAHPGAVFAAVDRGLLGAPGDQWGTGAGRSAQQQARVAARLLVRWCAARVTGRPAAVFEMVQRCAECGSTDHGKPSLAGFPDLHISLAHRPGAVVAAAGWTPVGVDIEVPGTRGRVPATDLLSAAELAQVRAAADPAAAFRQLWVRKECLVKLGVATLDSVQDVDLAGAVGRPLAGGGTATRYGRLHVADWVDASTGATVAVAGGEPPVRGSFPGV